jgi:ribonucleoside-diphosphate reductase alpha chain
MAMTNRWLQTKISRHVWETRYRYARGGEWIDKDIRDTWRRVARAAASAEASRADDWERRYYSILEGFRFMPAGRILAGAGTDRRVTLFNCFVMGLIRDDLESIFENLKEGAMTMQAGGGVGYDFSTLRPAGSSARATGRIASGPVSFLHIWDVMCATLLSTGARRGAMIASLRCDHPDIARFVDAKRDPAKLRHFNLSVQVTDEFMNAVDSDADWTLVFPESSLNEDNGAETLARRWTGTETAVPCRVLSRVPARELWERIMRAAFETAEPGVLFVDRINEANNLAYREHISASNPCGEVPLPPYGACNLGSVNLAQFVVDPFRETARLDIEAITETAALAVRLLDSIIDISLFPLAAQARQATGSRRIGLGITGLADALIMMGLHYGREDARREAARAMEAICLAAYRASIDLAREKGSFPFFEHDAYLRGGFVRTLPESLRDRIRQHGIRNSHLTAIAPTGTISLLANNISSGLEPVFGFRFDRRVLDRDGQYRLFELEDFAHRCWRQQGRSPQELPASFVRAHDLEPSAHLEMQAALQPFVDNAISKTVNVPESCPFEAFRSLYRSAWEKGLKGCTTFRPNPVTGAILDSRGVHCCTIEREGD